MHKFITFPLAVAFCLCAFLPLSNSGVLGSRKEAAKNDIQTIGLYNTDDKVHILTDTNFKASIIDKNYASLVEFYNSYCGHCKRFAPVYKTLAENTWSWQDVIKIMAIDCAAEENNDICREYEVMAYPTMRYIAPKFQPSEDNYGVNIMARESDQIEDALALQLMNETAPDANWPKFSNLTANEAKNLFKDLPEQVKYVLLVFDSGNTSTLAAQTILNFNRYPQLHIRRVADEKLAEGFQLNSTHHLVAIDRNKNMQVLPRAEASVAGLKAEVAKFIDKKQLTETPEVVDESNLEENTLMEVEMRATADKNSAIIKEVKRHKHFVYQADLEQAVRLIILNEIPRVNDISGERLLALQRFLNVLQAYNPLGPNGRAMVQRLRDYVMTNKDEVDAKEFKQKADQLMTELSPVFSSNEYVGCIGSKPNFRGFTCSLWHLFHYFTVQHAASENSNDPLLVFQAIHGVVKNFFGCTDCAEHFQEMASRRKIWNTPTKNEAVLWLWEAHNEVNNRLAGDETEDPQFPKIQYPSKASCPQCHNNVTTASKPAEVSWNRDAVLSFLKNIYNPEYVSKFGLNDPSVLLTDGEKVRQKRMIGNVFSDMDMRMGMLLYGFCIAMMIIAFKLFAFKGYRKKPYAHDFLGKV